MKLQLRSGFLMALCLAGVAHAGDGAIDTSFGANGLALTGVTDQYGASNGCKPVVQADGKIVICGTRTQNGSSGADFLVARFNANGTLDTTFNFNGMVTVDFDGGTGGSSGDVANAVAVQGDGKIVVAGSTHGAAAGSSDFAIARLLPDGTLDMSFGAGTGKTTVAFDLNAGTGDDLLNSMTLQADGKIVLSGNAQTPTGTQFAVARLLGDGTRDSSFNLNGKVSFAFAIPGVTAENDAASYVALDSSDRILLSGTVSYTNATSQNISVFAAARLLPNGQLDANFHANGLTTIAFDPGNGISAALALSGLLQRDGNLIIVGYANSSTSATANYDMAIARLLPNGSPDSTFGFGGKTLIAFDLAPNGLDAAIGAAEQGNGRLVLAGLSVGPLSGSNSSELGTAARLNPDGSLDQSFGALGKQTYNLGLGLQQGFIGVGFQGTQIIASGVTTGATLQSIDNVVVRLKNDLIFANGFE